MLNIPVHQYTSNSPPPHGQPYEGEIIHSEDFGLIALMRSGMTMATAVHELLPSACVGHAGYRYVSSEFEGSELLPFYNAVPHLRGRFCFVFDALIVTGHSLVALLRHMFTKMEADPAKTVIITAIATKQGADLINSTFSTVNIPIFAAACDKKIVLYGSKSYAVPGAGIFQERMFGGQVTDEKKFDD